MSSEPVVRSPLDVDTVAAAALELAAGRELGKVSGRFLEIVRTWACPSAVLAAVRAPQDEAGWRLLPALCTGSLPLGAERWLARIVEDAPGCLERPTVIEPRDEVPGVRVRDNWVVPWSCEAETGLLLLRGVPRPQPPNLGQALALVAAPLWPRLLGSPASRLERLLYELQGAATRVQAEAARQIDRMQATGAEAADAVGGRARQAEQALEQAEQEIARLSQALRAAQDAAEQRPAGGGEALEAVEARLRAAEEALAAERASAEQSLAAAQQARLAAEQTLAAVERQRVADADARASAEQGRTAAEQRLAELQQEQDAGRRRLAEQEEQRAAAEQARTAAEQSRLAAEQTLAAVERQRAGDAEARAAADQARVAAEQRLADLEHERDAARQKLARLEEERGAAEQARGTAEQALAAVEQQRTAEAQARAEAEQARLDLEAARARFDQERESAQRKLAVLEEERGVAEQARATAERARLVIIDELDALRAQASAAQSSRTDAERHAAELERALVEARAQGERNESALASARDELQSSRGELAAAQKELASARSEVRRWERQAAESAAAVSPVVDAARSALATVRRAAFVPAGVRFAMDEVAAALVAGDEQGPAPRLRVAVLDRDLGGLGALPAELEAAGVEARIANYPEELGLLLKTPGARDLALAVCDVMAFRPDQNISALMHSWRRDRPGLVFLLSSVADSTVELERVRRVPSALIAGQLPRPLTAAALVEAAEAAARRQARA